jgi:hypothetical protein
MLVRPALTRRLPVIAAACLVSVALPAAGVVAKEKIKGGSKPPATVSTTYDVSIPTIDAVGSNVPDDVIRDVLSGNLASHANTLADLDATSISVPQIVVSMTSQVDGQPYSADFTISGLQLDNVNDGVAGAVTLDAITMDMDDGSFEFGEMSAADFNIAAMLGVYGLVDSGSTGMQTIYTDFFSSGGTLEADDMSCTFGSTSGAEFKARPLRTSFADIMALAESTSDDPDDIDPALLGQIMRMYADIFTAFETSEVTFEGLSCSGTDEDDRVVHFDIAGMVMGGMSPGAYPSLSVDGLNVEIEGDGTVTVANFTFKPMDLRDVITVLENAPAEVDEVWLEANARGLIPAMEGFSFSGIDIDVPDPDEPDTRIKASVGAFDVSLASYINGIPTDLDISATNIAADLPEDSGDEAMEQLRALGITAIDGGFRIAAAWNESTDTIEVEEVSMSGVDLATVMLAGSITNATSDLFALDTDNAIMAAMDLAVKSLNLSVNDAGLSDIILSMVAAEQGTDAATLRPVFAGLAQGTVIGFLSDVADAAKLGEAINLFVAGKAKNLHIGIEAKADPGIGVFEFLEAQDDPTKLLGKVNVSAEAK